MLSEGLIYIIFCAKFSWGPTFQKNEMGVNTKDVSPGSSLEDRNRLRAANHVEIDPYRFLQVTIGAAKTASDRECVSPEKDQAER